MATAGWTYLNPFGSPRATTTSTELMSLKETTPLYPQEYDKFKAEALANRFGCGAPTAGWAEHDKEARFKSVFKDLWPNLYDRLNVNSGAPSASTMLEELDRHRYELEQRRYRLAGMAEQERLTAGGRPPYPPYYPPGGTGMPPYPYPPGGQYFPPGGPQPPYPPPPPPPTGSYYPPPPPISGYYPPPAPPGAPPTSLPMLSPGSGTQPPVYYCPKCYHVCITNTAQPPPLSYVATTTCPDCVKICVCGSRSGRAEIKVTTPRSWTRETLSATQTRFVAPPPDKSYISSYNTSPYTMWDASQYRGICAPPPSQLPDLSRQVNLLHNIQENNERLKFNHKVHETTGLVDGIIDKVKELQCQMQTRLSCDDLSLSCDGGKRRRKGILKRRSSYCGVDDDDDDLYRGHLRRATSCSCIDDYPTAAAVNIRYSPRSSSRYHEGCFDKKKPGSPRVRRCYHVKPRVDCWNCNCSGGKDTPRPRRFDSHVY